MFLEICRELKFPAEACDVLEQSRQKIFADPTAAAEVHTAMDSLFTPENTDYLNSLQKISDQTGVHRYIVDMVFLTLGVEPLLKVYAEKGLPEHIMWDSMEDLRYKLIECKDVYGIWGTFVTPWFKWFYTCQRFKLGRLEFEQVTYDAEEPYRNAVKKNDTVINCHIPSSGPLTRESVLDSLHRAYEFYQDLFPNGVMPLVCHSWLLYPPHYQEVFPKGSNLRNFCELFDVVHSDADVNNGDFWRVFNCEYSPEALEQVETDTTLRRNLLKFLKSGKTMGYSMGVLLYDGEKILK